MNFLWTVLDSIFGGNYYSDNYVVLDSKMLFLKEKLSNEVQDLTALAQEAGPIDRRTSHWLARAISFDPEQHNNRRFLHQGLTFLYNFVPLEFGWLASLLPSNLSENKLQRIISYFKGDKSFTIYKKLAQVNNELLLLSPSERFLVALFASKGFRPGRSYYKKSTFGLPRTLILDAVQNQFYILSKSYVPTAIPKSTYKRVCHGMAVPFEPAGHVLSVAQAVNLDDASAADLLHECRLHEQLYRIHPVGIWPLWHVYSYKKSGSSVEKVSVVAPFADGTLDANSLSLEAICQVLEGLSTLHAAGVVHGDLKETNILVRRTPIFTAGLNDFGFAFNQTLGEVPDLFSSGFYGVIDATAPELLTTYRFEGDYRQCEMWSFGHMLYYYYFGRELPWSGYIDILRHQKAAYSVQSIKQAMKETIDADRKSVLENLNTSRDKLKFLICELMQYEPDKRPNAAVALAFCRRLQKEPSSSLDISG